MTLKTTTMDYGKKVLQAKLDDLLAHQELCNEHGYELDGYKEKVEDLKKCLLKLADDTDLNKCTGFMDIAPDSVLFVRNSFEFVNLKVKK